MSVLVARGIRKSYAGREVVAGIDIGLAPPQENRRKEKQMTPPLKDIAHSIDIEAPRTTVWDVMTGAGSVPHWLGCMNYDMRPGATFHIQPDRAKRAAGDISGATWCDVEALKAPELFTFSWYMPGTPKTTVSIRLEDLGGDVTRATLTHSGWSPFPAEMVQAIHAMLDGRWKSFVLPNLKTAAEAFRKAMS